MTNVDNRLMVIVDDSTSYPILTEEQSQIIVYKHLRDITEGDCNYLAYAASKEVACNENITKIIREAYNNIESRIYIYGNLTINEFKNILKIDEYCIDTEIYNETGITGEKAKMHFSEEQELNKVEQIISLSKNSNYQSLMVSAPKAVESQMELIIIEHYIETFVGFNQKIKLVQNAFNYRNYPYMGDIQLTTCYLNLDYYLYKSDDEDIVDYDYFAIMVNANPIYDNPSVSMGTLSCTNLQVKLSLPYSKDHFYEYGPHSTSRATNIGVSIGYSGSGVSGTLNFTFSPGSRPSVDASFNSTSREILWSINRYWFFGQDLNNELYSLGASWASYGKLAAVDIYSFVTFADCNSEWNKIQVRYSY